MEAVGDVGPGDLYATRRRSLSDAEIEAGLACTLPMGLTGDLREQLAEQEELAALSVTGQPWSSEASQAEFALGMARAILQALAVRHAHGYRVRADLESWSAHE